MLTGDHVVLSSHMIMDIGTPINPTIDVGQIEGAFTQGMGWCTIEEPLVSPTTGFLFTRGPGDFVLVISNYFAVRVVQNSRFQGHSSRFPRNSDGWRP